MDQPKQAVARGQLAVEQLTRLNDPYVRWFADNLRRYGAGGSPAGLGLPALWPPTAGGAAVLAGVETPPPDQATGPDLLRQALNAARAMPHHGGSGLKRVPPDTRRRRLQMCASCEYHTGLRCRVCGCFTSTKTWMVHERCPLGRWTA